jgi:hypothetical protein
VWGGIGGERRIATATATATATARARLPHPGASEAEPRGEDIEFHSRRPHNFEGRSDRLAVAVAVAVAVAASPRYPAARSLAGSW